MSEFEARGLPYLFKMRHSPKVKGLVRSLIASGATPRTSTTNSRTSGGWNGYTTRRPAPCRLMGNPIAPFHNWWNLYDRLFDGEHHREAVTNRPALKQGVARETQSGGRRTIKVGLLHEKGDIVMLAVSLLSGRLHAIRSITERWSALRKWTLLPTLVLRDWLGANDFPGCLRRPLRCSPASP